MVSILVGSTLAPSKVLGVDLDPSLIAKAREQLAQRVAFLAAQNKKTQTQTTATVATISTTTMRPRVLMHSSAVPPPAAAAASSSTVPVSSLSRFAGAGSKQAAAAAAARSSTSAATSASPVSTATAAAAAAAFPSNVTFECGDLLTHPLGPSSSFDVVLCLSLTKWIHFHAGDAGIKIMFARIDTALSPGGLCILEPQPFASYKKKAALSDKIKANYKSIQLKSTHTHRCTCTRTRTRAIPLPSRCLLPVSHFQNFCVSLLRVRVLIRPGSFPDYVHSTHGWTLIHTFTHADPAGEADKKTAAAAASSSSAASSNSVPTAAPAGGFQARLVYVFRKPACASQ
jgi:hypothetical protein